MALLQFNVIWDWLFCSGMWVSKDYTSTGAFKTFYKDSNFAKDKRRWSDAARSGHQRKRLCITQKFACGDYQKFACGDYQKFACGDYVPGGH